jgi:uncharacterized cupredoxin-like copper-binding protein
VRIRATLLGATGALALLAAGCGGSSDDAAARRIEITMVDHAFAPSQVAVPAGVKVQLVFRTPGTVAHDAFIGDERAQADHEAEMRAGGGMGMDHHGGGDGAITVGPGKTGTLTRTFRAGERVLVGCHEPGHYAAGMKLALQLS